jgi:hypothetical protein
LSKYIDQALLQFEDTLSFVRTPKPTFKQTNFAVFKTKPDQQIEQGHHKADTFPAKKAKVTNCTYGIRKAYLCVITVWLAWNAEGAPSTFDKIISIPGFQDTTFQYFNTVMIVLSPALVDNLRV